MPERLSPIFARASGTNGFSDFNSVIWITAGLPHSRPGMDPAETVAGCGSLMDAGQSTGIADWSHPRHWAAP